ncbi:MAG: signal peptide peptidase SppA [Opitutales bacterium]|nr:signal peptide peptidase SppA [Opitutales bacterium]
MKTLKKIFQGCAIGCAGIVVGMLLMIILPIMIVSSLLSDAVKTEMVVTPTLQENTVLVIDIGRGFKDAPTYSDVNSPLFGSGTGSYGLNDTVRAIVAAAGDENIAAILLKGENCGASLATIDCLRTYLADFAKDKPVYAYLTNPSQSDYLLAGPATMIMLNSGAEFSFIGVATEHIYIKNLLEKAGIGIQVTKVGKYKSAVEPLICDTMSEADRAQSQAIIDARWDYILANASARTKFSREQLEALAATEPFLSPERAKQLGFVDAVGQDSDLIRFVCEKTGKKDEALESFRQVSLKTYMDIAGIAKNTIDPKEFVFSLTNANLNKVTASPEISSVALLVVEGEIVDNNEGAEYVCGKKYAALVRKLRNDSSVKAVVMRVNSPGGSVYASEQIRYELELLAKEKPLYVSFGDVAASGGYWISTPAQKIYASPYTLTGSIGVFGILPNIEGLTQKIGINSLALKTAPYADINSVMRPRSEAEMAIIQKTVDEIYGNFISLVAKSRNLPKEHVEEIAQGRVWTGMAAKRIGLVDDFDSLENILDYAKKESGADTIAVYPEPSDPAQILFDLFNEDSGESPVSKISKTLTGTAVKGAIPRPADKLYQKSVRTLDSLDDPNNVYARLPWITAE